MKKDKIQSVLTRELEKRDRFENWHGITAENLTAHLVEPYSVTVVADGDGTDPTVMWIVLRELLDESAGYLIAYCPSQKEWCLVERLGYGTYLCDTAGDKSLADALSNM